MLTQREELWKQAVKGALDKMLHKTGKHANCPLQEFFHDLRNALETKDTVHIVSDGAKVLPLHKSCTLRTKRIKHLRRFQSEVISSVPSTNPLSTSKTGGSKDETSGVSSSWNNSRPRSKSLEVPASSNGHMAANGDEELPNILPASEGSNDADDLEQLVDSSTPDHSWMVDTLQLHRQRQSKHHDAVVAPSLSFMMTKFPHIAAGGTSIPSISDRVSSPCHSESLRAEVEVFSAEWWSKLDTILS